MSTARFLPLRRSVAWFTRKNYLAHRALDPAGLPATFDEWRSRAVQQVEQEDQGIRVVFSPRQFSAWCRAEGRAADASARATFAHVVDAAARSRGWWQRRAISR